MPGGDGRPAIAARRGAGRWGSPIARPDARAFVEVFPGGQVLRGRNLLRVERVLTAVRLAILAAAAAVFRLSGAPLPDPPLAWGVCAAGAAYLLLTAPLTDPRRRLSARVRSAVMVVLDTVLILSAVLATGGGHGPLLPVLFVGVVAAPVRLDRAAGLAATAVYSAAWVLLAEPHQRSAAAFVALCGVLSTVLTTFMRRTNTEQVRDPLTHCFGRRQALLFVEHLLAGQALPFAVILLDFDGFKRINDRFGHAAGDATLHALAQVIARDIPAHDLLARIGGDEFLVVAPGMDGTSALAVAERIRASVDRTPLAVPNVQPQPALSCSAGVAEAARDDTVASLLDRADRHLYLAKRRRNQVLLASAQPARAHPEP